MHPNKKKPHNYKHTQKNKERHPKGRITTPISKGREKA
jgi:hypothetical protein